MNINQAFPSKWLSATDLGQAKPVVVISGVTSEAINQNEPPKLVIHFQGKQKGMVLNKTNAMNIAAMYGPETDSWTGKAITLYTTFVDFQGKSVPGPQGRATDSPGSRIGTTASGAADGRRWCNAHQRPEHAASYAA